MNNYYRLRRFNREYLNRKTLNEKKMKRAVRKNNTYRLMNSLLEFHIRWEILPRPDQEALMS